MGYRELESRIRSDFQAEVDEIGEKAGQEADAVLEDIRREAAENADEARAAGSRKAELEYRRRVGKARLDAMNAAAAEKARLTDKVLAEAGEKIKSLPDEKKAAYLKRLAGDARLIEGKATVKVSRENKRLLKGVKNVEESDIGFGVVIESADGSARVDNRLETIMGRARVKLKPDVGRILFGR